MATPILDVYLPDGTQQSYELTDTRVVVGTAPKCQVVIDQPEFVAEHLLISPRSDGCGIIVARGVATPTLVDGQPFERGLVPYEATITIGQVKLVPRDGKRVRRAAEKEGDGKKEEKVSPVLLIAAALILPFALYQSFQDPASSAPGRVQQAPPPLFDEFPSQCPQRDGALVRSTAEESARIALSKAERMPFRTQDGIEAVNYYAQSAACYRGIGEARAAELALRQANLLKARLEDEYRAHQFRLERAMEQERTADALYETRMLAALVAHRRGAYLTALNTLERQLTLRIDQAAAAQR